MKTFTKQKVQELKNYLNITTTWKDVDAMEDLLWYANEIGEIIRFINSNLPIEAVNLQGSQMQFSESKLRIQS
jgi:hypothetical protein